jgi:hypothetical protein
MKIIKPYFEFEDERGSIKGIINKCNCEELNIFQLLQGK